MPKEPDAVELIALLVMLSPLLFALWLILKALYSS